MEDVLVNALVDAPVGNAEDTEADSLSKRLTFVLALVFPTEDLRFLAWSSRPVGELDIE